MLHTAGPMSPKVIQAIYRHIRHRRIDLSVETGSGASTLLLSHCSGKHLVFAQDDCSGSIRNVRKSPLLNPSTVEFIEGPTQQTLPRFTFRSLVQCALIDGPHAYPFPDLEYYYIYQALAEGALLVLDDIHIRTVNHLFAFLKEDAMFRLDEVVGATAFFRRTNAPTFCPTSDGWQSQGYNRKLLHRYDWERQVRELLPAGTRRVMKSIARALQTDCGIWIDQPEPGSVVGNTGVVHGHTKGNVGRHALWVLVRREGQTGWWPQGREPVPVQDGAWQCAVEYGGPPHGSRWFEIAAILANAYVHSYLIQWGAGAEADPRAPIQDFPFRTASIADAYRRVERRA